MIGIKKVFIICPVRNATDGQKCKLMEHMERLNRMGIEVYYPAIHTDQSGNGSEICRQNKRAIAAADEIHILYDQTSSGSLFDLGVAFALNKPLALVDDVERTDNESFANIIKDWAHDR